MARATATPDFTKPFENMFENADMSVFNDAFKNVAEFNSKFSSIVLNAAEKNAELSQAWTKETLKKLQDVTKPHADPADYAKAIADVTTASAQATPDHLAAFAEVAKKAQMDAIELMTTAGKEVQTKATTAAKRAAK